MKYVNNHLTPEFRIGDNKAKTLAVGRGCQNQGAMACSMPLDSNGFPKNVCWSQGAEGELLGTAQNKYSILLMASAVEI